MNDSPLTAETAFAQTRLIRAIQETCAPRQRALFSLLAISKRHDLNTAELVSSLSRDLPRTPLESVRNTGKFYWSRVQDFSEELTQVQAIPEGLEKFPELLPKTVELALRLVQERGMLNELNDEWLNRPPDYALDTNRIKPFVASMFPLFLKALVILSLASFLMIFIVPEFMDMLEEFDVAVPYILQLTIQTVKVVIRFAFVPVLLMLISIPFSILSLQGYLKRWNPFIWQQPILPPAVSTRQALALVAAYGKSISLNALSGFPKLNQANVLSSDGTHSVSERQLDWHELAAQRIISGKEAQALELAGSGAVQAWLLEASAIKQKHRIESRGLIFTRAVVTTVNVILGTLVLLLASSIFLTLISIMSHLS